MNDLQRKQRDDLIALFLATHAHRYAYFTGRWWQISDDGVWTQAGARGSALRHVIAFGEQQPEGSWIYRQTRSFAGLNKILSELTYQLPHELLAASSSLRLPTP